MVASTAERSRRGGAHRRQDSLFRNGLALVINSAITSLLGSGYWVLAAHRTSRASVGEATALVSALAALSMMSQLSLGGALSSFLPRAGRHSRRLVLVSYLVTVGLGLVIGGGFAVIASRANHSFGLLRPPLVTVEFAAAVAVWGVFSLQDSVLTGLRRASIVPIENVIYSTVKLASLALVGGSLTALTLFATWVVPAAVALLPVNLLVWRRLLPSSKSTGDGEVDGFRRFLAGDTTGMFLSQIGVTLLPVLVVTRLGSVTGGAFGIAWMLLQPLDLVAINLGMSLTVEGAQHGADVAKLYRKVVGRSLPLVAVCVVVGCIGAPYVLGLFGAEYAKSATTVLRLLLLGSLGRAVAVFTLCAARARRDTRQIIILQGLVACLVPTTAWILGGRYGLVGIGIAWAGSQLVIGAVAFVLRARTRAGEIEVKSDEDDSLRQPLARRQQGGQRDIGLDNWIDSPTLPIYFGSSGYPARGVDEGVSEPDPAPGGTARRFRRAGLRPD